MNPYEQSIYEAGREARRLCIAKRGCPYGIRDLRKRCWWMAGWNDRDMEMSKMEDAA